MINEYGEAAKLGLYISLVLVGLRWVAETIRPEWRLTTRLSARKTKSLPN